MVDFGGVFATFVAGRTCSLLWWMELGGITFIDVIYTIPYETPVSIYVFVLCYGYCLAFDLATKSQGFSAVSIEIDIIYTLLSWLLSPSYARVLLCLFYWLPRFIKYDHICPKKKTNKKFTKSNRPLLHSQLTICFSWWTFYYFFFFLNQQKTSTRLVLKPVFIVVKLKIVGYMSSFEFLALIKIAFYIKLCVGENFCSM